MLNVPYKRALSDASRDLADFDFVDVYDLTAIQTPDYRVNLIGLTGSETETQGAQESLRECRSSAVDGGKTAVGVALLSPAAAEDLEAVTLVIEPNATNRLVEPVDSPDAFRAKVAQWCGHFAAASRGFKAADPNRRPPGDANSGELLIEPQYPYPLGEL